VTPKDITYFRWKRPKTRKNR